MRSLVITLNAPIARNGGAAIRNEQTIRSLARLGPVDLVALGMTESGSVFGIDHLVTRTYDQLASERRPVERLRKKTWVLRPRGHWRLETYRSSAALREVGELARRTRPELVVASQWQTGEYALRSARHGARLVFDTHNIEADLRAVVGVPGSDSGSRKARLANARLRGWEQRLAGASSEVWVCSSEDEALWRRVYGDGDHLEVVPNTVTTDVRPRWGEVDRVPGTIVFTGTLSYRPNVDAAIELAEEILPAVRTAEPAASLRIIGREPNDDVLWLDSLDGVDIVGPVEEMAPHLAGADVMVVPLRTGGGTRLKILEAMAVGVPVVSTPKGAEGIKATDGEHLLLAESPRELARATASLIADPGRAARMSDAARGLVERSYSPAALDRLVERSVHRMGLT